MKKVIISEAVSHQIVSDILTEALIPSSEKVLIVKDFIDSHFAKNSIDDIDANGYPTKTKTVVMLNDKKQPMKTLQMPEFLLYLDSEFHSMIKDDGDRKKFLKQVIIDWYNGKIGRNGVLSVNLLR